MVAFKSRRHRKHPSPQEGREAFFKKAGSNDSYFFSPATQNSIQTKLTIGKPGDAFEREADAVADRVVNQQQQQLPMDNVAPGVQRQETIQSQDDQTSPRLQMQDEEELEAKPELQMQEEKEEENVATKPELQMQEEKEEEKVATKPESRSQSAGKLLTSQLQRTKGQGHPLPKPTQLEMGKALDQDFSTVRIHTDQVAVDMNRQLKSQAFTHGKDIYFNQGKFDPESKTGKQLLAHELTHVVQQNKK